MKKTVLGATSFLAAAAICMPSTTLAGDWPQFRGPGSLGVSDELSLPTN